MRLRLHHLGVLVSDIPKALAEYVERFGYEVCSQQIHDPVQTAFVQFLKLPDDNVFLEFVSPDGPTSKLANALKQGSGLNHVCYQVEDIEASCASLRSKGLYLLQVPVSAAAFPGRRIAWLLGQDRVPIELVEPPSGAGP
jgi:methylmalonyl-CoA/ethylmalonyl-CoA epimerase